MDLTKKCRVCGSELSLDTNWEASREKRWDNICRSCRRIQQKASMTDAQRYARSVTKKARERVGHDIRPDNVTQGDFVNVCGDALLFKKHGHPCHVDHIIPLAAGGCHCPSNTQAIPVGFHMLKNREDNVWIWLHKEVYGQDFQMIPGHGPVDLIKDLQEV